MQGVPRVVVSDNSPQFVSTEMEWWFSAIGCEYMWTPPYHLRSNGLVEQFVRMLKDHLRCAGKNNI